MNERGNLEDIIASVLEPDFVRIIGGATGHEHAYIDLLLYDGQASLDLLAGTLRKSSLGRVATIEFFAKSRTSDRIILQRR